MSTAEEVWTPELLEHLQKRIDDRYRGLEILSVDGKPRVSEYPGIEGMYSVKIYQYVAGECFFGNIMIAASDRWTPEQRKEHLGYEIDGLVRDLRAYIEEHIGEGGISPEDET